MAGNKITGECCAYSALICTHGGVKRRRKSSKVQRRARKEWAVGGGGGEIYATGVAVATAAANGNVNITCYPQFNALTAI